MNRVLAIFAALMVSVCTYVFTARADVIPATQPDSSSEPTVLVLPIEPPSGSYAWIGRAIQQDMLVDLTHVTRARILAPAKQAALEPDAALRDARDAGASYVVFGSVQTSGAQLRVTGQVLDVATGRSLSGIKATAPIDNLFPLEDALAMQVARALPSNVVRERALASGPTTLPTVINEPYVSEATPMPQYDYVPSPDYSHSPGYEAYPYAYPPDYYYPGYGALGWWGPGVIIVGPHRFGDHDRFDHFNRFDHRNFVSPHVNPGFHSRGFSGNGSFRGSSGFGSGRGGAMSGGGHFGGGGHAGGGGRGR